MITPESPEDAIRLICRAVRFASQAHADQRRKGARAEPYVNHVIEVAALVAESEAGRHPTVVIAALLHDTVEDTATTRDDLESAFGATVATIVGELTDDKSLPKAERKRLQIESAAGRSFAARLVTLADKISNLRSLAESPPHGWAVERRRAYVDWARDVVDRLRGTDPTLEALFDVALAQARAACDATDG